MSTTYRLWNPNQQWLLPPCPQDWLPQNDLVYFLLDTVNELDISAIIQKYEQEERGYRLFPNPIIHGSWRYFEPSPEVQPHESENITGLGHDRVRQGVQGASQGARRAGLDQPRGGRESGGRLRGNADGQPVEPAAAASTGEVKWEMSAWHGLVLGRCLVF